MTKSLADEARETCETILREDKQQNLELKILPSRNLVIDRLLLRRVELGEAYVELHDKLGRHPPALTIFFDVLLGAAAFWNPAKVAESRQGRRRLETVNAMIADRAADLAELLREREALHNHSGFAGDTPSHIGDVIESAAERNPWFNSWLRKPLGALRGQFDSKYWPEIHEVIDAVGLDAKAAALEPTDPVTAAATTGPRGSLADFFKALYAGLNENGAGQGGFLPSDFRLSDESLAVLGSCALDLGPDDLVAGTYIKRLRQRGRAAARSTSEA